MKRKATMDVNLRESKFFNKVRGTMKIRAARQRMNVRPITITLIPDSIPLIHCIDSSKSRFITK